MEVKKHQLMPEIRQINGIDKNDQIFFSIQIGNGQIGGTKIILEGKQLAKGNIDQPTFIGDTETLLDKELEVETNVLDVNSFTNKCVITTKILNQDHKELFSKIDSDEAPENGIVSFSGKYKLTVLSMLVLLFVFFNLTFLSAQSINQELTFQGLQTPSSPGLILLDKAPSSIERPTTPQGFGVNVLGLFQGTGGAIEFAPFWLVDRPNVTADQMYKTKVPMLYHFSVSAATIKTDSLSYVASGFRTRLLQSYGKEGRAKLDSLKQEIELALADLDLKKIESLQNQYTACFEKPVFTIDIAGAIGGRAVSNSFSYLERNRWAAWMSFNWRPKADDFYATALVRYLNNEKHESYSTQADLLDVGARLNYDISKLCISLEYLQRFNFTQNNGPDYRIAVVGSYELTKQIYFTATFGKNFSNVDNIIALAGINFGISNTKVKAF